MSVTLERPPTSWQTRPGWGIAIDLTPRQVVAARQVKVHQRLIALALLLVLLLCVGVSLLVRADRSAAEETYAEEQTRTAGLAAAADQYADITAMQAVTTRVQGDLVTLMGLDVDVVNLLARVNVALPPGVRITEQAVVLNPPTPVVAAPAADPADAATPDPAVPAPAPVADPTVPTGAVIGSMTLSGTADQIASVTSFVQALDGLDGATDVLPTLVARTDTGSATYTLTANLTDVLLTGRYTTEAP